MKPANLTIESVRVRFGPVLALADVTLEVPPGAITALIGPNGAGKTTLLNAIAGEFPLDSGRIMLDGRPIHGLSSPAIAASGVSRVFQDVRLFDSLSPVDNLALAFLSRHKEPRLSSSLLPGNHRLKMARARALENLRPYPFVPADRPCHELSWGTRKIVALLRALAQEPRVLLLDEAFAGVHSSLAVHFVLTLRESTRQGLTVLMVEHDPAVLRDFADHIAVMRDGVIRQTGSAATILANHPTLNPEARA